MSSTGNCYDNAPMESFWGTLKQELVYHERYRTREEAKQSITEYIEVFYNDSVSRQSLAFCHLWLMSKNSTPGPGGIRRFGVHY